MRRLLTVLAAVMFFTVILAAPVQAQHRVQRPQYTKPPLPRAFNKKYQDRIARKTNGHARRSTVRARTVNPRFYNVQAASRAATRLKYRTQSRVRANLSPARRSNPGFRNPRSMKYASKQIRRNRTRIKQARRAHRARVGRARPSLWQ